MRNTIGNQVSLTLFGESHGAAIGAVLDGIAAGFAIDTKKIDRLLALRRGEESISTTRREADKVHFLSGVVNGVTTGTPICLVIENQNTDSKVYDPEMLRPSHADYCAKIKYNGHQDYRGGGHFSGRITAALTAAGSIAAQILQNKGILVASRLKQVHDVSDIPLPQDDLQQVTQNLADSAFPVLDSAVAQKMRLAIEEAKSRGDSVGGVVETVITGVPAGVGEPWFDSLESALAKMIFAIPGVKGVSFGGGFEMCQKYGSEVNDAFCFDRDNNVKTATNFSGGINGGIANGMPIVMQTGVKPTPSIFLPQQSVRLDTMEEVSLQINGRHDPAIVHRALHVINSAAALTVLDMICMEYGTRWQVE